MNGNGLVLLTTSNINTISSFFTNFSASGDVGGALATTGIAFKIAITAIMMMGALAMAIWIVRIAVDIILLAARGTAIAKDGGFLSKLGTGKAEGYADVKSYVVKNLPEILLMFILIIFLITGWLFQIVALAITGFGILGNKLLGLDLTGSLSALDAESFKENLGYRQPSSLKAQYEEELGAINTQAMLLYDMGKSENTESTSFKQAKTLYTSAWVKAELIANQLSSVGGVERSFGVASDYFQQHRSTLNGVCNKNFEDKSVSSKYGVQIYCNR